MTKEKALQAVNNKIDRYIIQGVADNKAHTKHADYKRLLKLHKSLIAK